MFPTALVLLALDDKDPGLIDAIIAGAGAFGLKRVLLVHIHNQDPVPAAVADLMQAEAPPRPPQIDEACERLKQALPELSIEAMNPVGTPEAVLARLTEEQDVDLVVLGRGPAIGDQAGWGSSSRKILRLTTCTALVVPGGARLDLSRVVAGFDFSQYATMALGVACQIADSVDAVYQYSMSPARAGHTRESFDRLLKERAEKHLEQHVLPRLGKCPPPNIIIHGGDKVAQALISQAGTAPIVMGSRGLSPLAAVLIGSSADRVAGRAKGPVLIVRRKGSTLSLFERLFHKV